MRILTPLLIIAPALLVANCQQTTQRAGVVPVEMASDYRLRHPILVSPHGARLPHQCGQWHEDLGVQSKTNFRNESDWNYGCSTQHNLANIVKNPSDLVQARQEDPSNARRRQDAIDKYQKGTDPSTQWKVEDKNKSSQVGTGSGG